MNLPATILTSIRKLFFEKTVEKKGPRGASDFVPRAARVVVQPLHEISFTVGDYPLDVANISTSGIAVLYDSTKIWQLGNEIRGTLHLRNESFEVRLGIRHLSDRVAGCEFLRDPVSPILEIMRAIDRYLEVEILALSLKKGDCSHRKVDPRGRTHLYHDTKGSEIFFVTDSRGVVYYRLSFLGRTIEGARGRSLPLDDEAMKLAHTLIQNVPGIAVEYRAEMSRGFARQSG